MSVKFTTKGKQILREKLIVLAGKMNINVKDKDINTTHRLGDKNKPNPPVIVRLNNRDRKNECIAQSKSCKLKGKDVGFDHSRPIYVKLLSIG